MHTVTIVKRELFVSQGSLETVELKLKKVQDDLNLTPEKFHIFTALFGNYLLSESDLTCLYAALGVDSSSKVH